MRSREVWRRAGRGGIEWYALCEPLSAEAVGKVAPGPRLQARGLSREPVMLRETAAQAPLGQVPRSRLVDNAIVLVVESGIAAMDELHLLAWRADAEAWQFDFRLRRMANPDLEPAPARLWLWTALNLGEGLSPQRVDFCLATEERMTNFSLQLLR